METAKLHSLLEHLKQSAPGAVLEALRFGNTSQAMLRVEPRALPELASGLARAPGVELDWLENLSVRHEGNQLVATYFVRSTRTNQTLILRAVAKLESESREVSWPTVTATWPTATPFEIEAGELLGIRFTNSQGGPAHAPCQRLPQGWNGYPLRKSYVFPTEFLGIPHSRRAAKEFQ